MSGLRHRAEAYGIVKETARCWAVFRGIWYSKSMYRTGIMNSKADMYCRCKCHDPKAPLPGTCMQRCEFCHARPASNRETPPTIKKPENVQE